MSEVPLHGTCKAVKARFWPCLSDENRYNITYMYIYRINYIYVYIVWI